MSKPLLTLVTLGTLLFAGTGRAQAPVSNNETLPQPQALSTTSAPNFVSSQSFSSPRQGQKQFSNLNLQPNLQGISDTKVEGGADAGGGDLCEDRIKIIRDDLEIWLVSGGAKQLPLPGAMNADQYSQAMLTQIGKAKIKCVGPGDSGYPVTMNKTPKVCRYDRTSSISHITCDFNKFQSMKEADQYVLIHHEFAGLAGVEIPNGDDSDYEVSNHISENLGYETVQKLVIKSDVDAYELIPDDQVDSVKRALVGAFPTGVTKMLCSGITISDQKKVTNLEFPFDMIFSTIHYAQAFYRKTNGQPGLKFVMPAYGQNGFSNGTATFFIVLDATGTKITSLILSNSYSEAILGTNLGTITNPSYSSSTKTGYLTCHFPQ